MTMQKIFDMSPTIQKMKADAVREAVREVASNTKRSDVVRLLEKRFGVIPDDLAAVLNGYTDPQQLDRVFDLAYDCTDLTAFRSSLSSFT